MQVQSITHQQVAELAMTLPFDRLVSAYDFLLFLKSTPQTQPTPDIFGATEAEIEADDKQWDELFSKGRDKMRAMAFEALDEIRAGETEPITQAAQEPFDPRDDPLERQAAREGDGQCEGTERTVEHRRIRGQSWAARKARTSSLVSVRSAT